MQSKGIVPLAPRVVGTPLSMTLPHSPGGVTARVAHPPHRSTTGTFLPPPTLRVGSLRTEARQPLHGWLCLILRRPSTHKENPDGRPTCLWGDAGNPADGCRCRSRADDDECRTGDESRSRTVRRGNRPTGRSVALFSGALEPRRPRELPTHGHDI